MIGTKCDSCGEFVWLESEDKTCPQCRKPTTVAPKASSDLTFGIKPDLPPGKGYIGAKAQYVRSRYHARELMKGESDRMKRDLRFVEGD